MKRDKAVRARKEKLTGAVAGRVPGSSRKLRAKTFRPSRPTVTLAIVNG